ncbi:sugar phosphate isomerase/epimerase [Luteolibacter sp. GHJ8]|uniref:Sugar phosphate isomerase/epimerase n=1 Tax=Luteolibacter rhizosphaerae TaxID=2989719 RepID=A0ABT3G7Y5_9BACT|nr:sugar phosphate isomerase/epimerase [Luteolibacter rhizosphaerae]MCW1915737.1 sugar phosphate isomerase/epimerase [Luteolibacter rhizosphaerae]
MNRRSFLLSSAASSLALAPSSSLLAALAKDNAYRANIGIQLYTLRDALSKDAAGTLKKVAEAGYKQVELYGFPNCQPLIDGAKAAGLAINSAHFEWDSVINPKDEAMSDFKKIVARAKELGIGNLVIPYLQDNVRKTLADYKKIAANANKAAAIAKKEGIQLSYHNHAFEFEPKEGGKTGYDVFIEEFSADMQFEIDVFWVKVAAKDPAELITKLSGRVSQLHLKDLKKDTKVPEFGNLPADAFKELGNGMIPMEPIIEAASKAGVKHCHVEQDQSPDALASIKQSIDYLAKL